MMSRHQNIGKATKGKDLERFQFNETHWYGIGKKSEIRLLPDPTTFPFRASIYRPRKMSVFLANAVPDCIEIIDN